MPILTTGSADVNGSRIFFSDEFYFLSTRFAQKGKEFTISLSAHSTQRNNHKLKAFNK